MEIFNYDDVPVLETTGGKLKGYFYKGEYIFKGVPYAYADRFRMPEKMTHTTLSRQLKTLEEEGLIVRKEYQQILPKVEYSLSEIGEKFKDVLAVLEVWGNEYIQYLQDKK